VKIIERSRKERDRERREKSIEIGFGNWINSILSIELNLSIIIIFVIPIKNQE
jgi:hypothetical protein